MGKIWGRAVFQWLYREEFSGEKPKQPNIAQLPKGKFHIIYAE